MWLFVAIVTAFAGWFALALAMPKHHRQILQRDPARPASHAYRATAIAALCVAYLACGFHSGWVVGPVTWFCVLSATAMLFVLLLSYQRGPHHARHRRAADE